MSPELCHSPAMGLSFLSWTVWSTDFRQVCEIHMTMSSRSLSGPLSDEHRKTHSMFISSGNVSADLQ